MLVSSTSLLPQDVKWLLQLQASHKHSRHQKEERQVTAKSVQFISMYHEIKSFPRSSHLSRFLHWSKWGHIANSSFKEGWELNIWQGTIGLTWLAEADIHYLSPGVKHSCRPNKIETQLARNKGRMDVDWLTNSISHKYVIRIDLSK